MCFDILQVFPFAVALTALVSLSVCQLFSASIIVCCQSRSRPRRSSSIYADGDGEDADSVYGRMAA